MATSPPTTDQIWQVLKPIHDPEIRIGIVDLGKVLIKMTLTTPACPYGEILLTQVHREVENMEGVTGVEVILVWDPPWDPREHASDAAKDMLGIW